MLVDNRTVHCESCPKFFTCSHVFSGECKIVEPETKEYIEIVRCQDCKHWYELKDSDPFRGVCSIWHMLHHGDWFCADGKRKED